MLKDPTYTLKDLAELTGFSERQIRFYITEGLVPGAGRKGPNATYGEPALRRLRLVGRLKEMPVQPTGRTLTLSEIREVLETLGEEGAAAMLDGGAELSILSTDDAPTGPTVLGKALPRESARDYINRVRRMPRSTMLFQRSLPLDMRDRGPDHVGEEMTLYRPSSPSGPLAALLRELHLVLRELTVDEQPPATGPAEAWRRIRTPDVEIQVRIPDTPRRRRDLEMIASEIERLLDPEVP